MATQKKTKTSKDLLPVDEAPAKNWLNTQQGQIVRKKYEIGENLFILIGLTIICLSMCYCHSVDAKKPEAANTTDSVEIKVN
jgi:hypothetical protein